MLLHTVTHSLSDARDCSHAPSPDQLTSQSLNRSIDQSIRHFSKKGPKFVDPLVIVISPYDDLHTRTNASYPPTDMLIASDVTGFV